MNDFEELEDFDEQPLKKERSITKKMMAFASAYAEHPYPRKAAIKAGVPEKSASIMGYRWLRDERVWRAIQDESKKYLRQAQTKLLKSSPSVLNSLLDISSEKKTSLAKFEACKHLLALAGMIAEQRTTTNSNVKADVNQNLTVQDETAVRNDFQTNLEKLINSTNETADTEASSDLPAE